LFFSLPFNSLPTSTILCPEKENPEFLDFLSHFRYRNLFRSWSFHGTFTHQAVGVEAAVEVAAEEAAELFEILFDASKITPKWLKQL